MQNMKVNGVKTKPMVVENSGMLMVIYMRENGKKIKQMDTVFTFMSMVPNMRVTGRMIFKMVREWRAGKTAAGMKVDTKKV